MSDANSSSLPGPGPGFERVSEPRQAAFVSDPRSNRYFYPFLGRERSVKEAATELGCKLNTMHYRVTRMLAIGLLRVARVEERAGRPMKYYRSTHDSLFVPDALTPFADAEELHAAGLLATAQLLAKGLAHGSDADASVGRCFFRDRQGVVVVNTCVERRPGEFELGRSEAGSSQASLYGTLTLTRAQAQGLRRELGELLGRYAHGEEGPGRDAKEYVYIGALAPVIES